MKIFSIKSGYKCRQEKSGEWNLPPRIVPSAIFLPKFYGKIE
jgi:hypothetical protein